MPIGCYSIVPHVVHLLEQWQPDSILDIGIGNGFYGAAIKQWVPSCRTLVGIEAWGGYRNALWDKYDFVHVENLWFSVHCDQYDVALLLDVIEHFGIGNGKKVVEITKQLGKNVIVATPAIFQAQGAVGGNEYERHRSLWTADMLREQGFRIVLDGSVNEFGHQMLLGAWEG